MRAIFAVFLLALIACGPSKLDVATKKCNDALAVNDYDAAVVACKEAMRLDRSDESLRLKWLRAGELKSLRDFQVAEDARHRQTLIERQVDAAERAAAAAELQANTLSRAESRQR